MSKIPLVIECADHKMAPYSFVCIHLLKGASRVAVRIPTDDEREVECDFCCPACARLNEKVATDADAEQAMVDALHVVCIHCVRDLQKRYHWRIV